MRTYLMLFAAVAATGWVTAQDDSLRLEEEVITAEKRESTGQDAALSVTAVSGDELESVGYDNLQDASLLVPNLYVNQFNVSRLTFPTIRGIGSGQGVPAVVRIDNLKTGIARGSGPWGERNRAYAAYARAVGFHISA